MRLRHRAIVSVSMILLSAAAAFSIRQLHRYRKAKASSDGPHPDIQTPSNHEAPGEQNVPQQEKGLNDLTLEKLTAAGWTPDRKVDYSKIEQAYRENNLILPPPLRAFFASFAYLKIPYAEDAFEIDPSYIFEEYQDEWYTYTLEEDGFDGFGFDGYKKDYLQPMFRKFGIEGEIYPIGVAYNYSSYEFYYLENGKFYLYIDDVALWEIGTNVHEMLNGLFGKDHSTWKILY